MLPLCFEVEQPKGGSMNFVRRRGQKMKNLINEIKEVWLQLSLCAIAVLIFMLLINSLNSSDEQCEMSNFKNNIVEMTCKDDLKIIKKFNDLRYEEWEQFKEKFNCKYVGHGGEFKCDNNIQVKRSDVFLSEWYTFRDENHCKLVEINKTVRDDQNHWLCDNNININNNFYK